MKRSYFANFSLNTLIEKNYQESSWRCDLPDVNLCVPSFIASFCSLIASESQRREAFTPIENPYFCSRFSLSIKQYP